MTTRLCFLGQIEEIVETVLCTDCERESKPLSILLIGPSGSAKSQLIKRYESKKIIHTDSITSQGLFSFAERDPENKLKFIILPDMNPTLSRKSSTMLAMTANLLSFTSDGTVRIDDGRTQKQCPHNPVGIISAATPDIFHVHAKKWYQLGLTRRIIPIFFDYNPSTIRKLDELVKSEEIKSAFCETIQYPEYPVSDPPIPDAIGQTINDQARIFAVNLGKLKYYDEGKTKWNCRPMIPTSPHIAMRSLAKAHAIRAGRTEVNHYDVEFLDSFVGFTDPERPGQI